MKPIELKRGDACPSCRGELKPAYVPTDEEFARAFDRENPIALPPGADTANKTQRSELGELHRCATCGYQTRFPDRGRTDRASTAGGSGGTSTPGAPAGGGSSVDQTDPDFLEWKRQKDAERANFRG